jgi:hypothetical protein
LRKFVLAAAAILLASTGAQAEILCTQHRGCFETGGRLMPLLPPLQYDHPYKGTVEIERAETDLDLRGMCPHYFPHGRGVACAWVRDNICNIVMFTDDILQGVHRMNPEHVFRHEIGHCNGWPGDHPGGRWRDGRLLKQEKTK